MKYESIKRCKNIEHPNPPHSFKILQSRALISPSATLLATVSPSTFQLDIGDLADTWLTELQQNSGQEGNDKDRQSIFNLIDKLFSAVKRRSKLNFLSYFAVEKPTRIQTLKNRLPQLRKIFQMLDSRIRARKCVAEARVQRRKVGQHLLKLSRTQNACLRKANATSKKRSFHRT